MPILIISLFLAAPQVFATAMLRASAMYMSSNIGGVEGSRVIGELNPAFVRDKGWAFGGTYQSDTVKNGSASLSTTAIGPTIGLITRREFGFYGLASYYFAAKRDDQMSGTGYQADGGYRFQFRHLSYALQISYKHFSFKGQGERAATLEVSRIDPYFVVWYEY